MGVLLFTGEGEEPPTRPPGAVAPQTLTAATPVAVTVPVVPNEPTQIVSPDGNVTISLAAGSVQGQVQLSYQSVEPQEVPPLPSGFVATEKVFDISLTDTSLSKGGPVELAKPITLTVRLRGCLKSIGVS